MESDKETCWKNFEKHVEKIFQYLMTVWVKIVSFGDTEAYS